MIHIPVEHCKGKEFDLLILLENSDIGQLVGHGLFGLDAFAYPKEIADKKMRRVFVSYITDAMAKMIRNGTDAERMVILNEVTSRIPPELLVNRTPYETALPPLQFPSL